MIVSRTVYTLSVPYGFPHRRIEQARAFPEVVAGVPVSIETRRSFWRNAADGLPRPIRVVGYPPADDAIDLPELRKRREEWGRPGMAMADRRSRPSDSGPLEAGTVSELSGKTVRILGTFELGVDYQSDGTLIMSDSTLARHLPRPPRRRRAGDDDVTDRHACACGRGPIWSRSVAGSRRPCRPTSAC